MTIQDIPKHSCVEETKFTLTFIREMPYTRMQGQCHDKLLDTPKQGLSSHIKVDPT